MNDVYKYWCSHEILVFISPVLEFTFLILLFVYIFTIPIYCLGNENKNVEKQKNVFQSEYCVFQSYTPHFVQLLHTNEKPFEISNEMFILF